MQDTRWDHGLKVTGEGEGLVGHAGAVPLRKGGMVAALRLIRPTDVSALLLMALAC